MAGPAINWESLAREDAIGPIVSSGRYRLDSPSTVTGSPTFAMGAAGQAAEIRVFLPNGKSIETPLAISGTTAVSLVDQVGKPFSQSDLALIEIDVAMPYGQNLLTTDEPNGSPSNPFATTTTVAELSALAQTGPFEIWCSNPNATLGMTKLRKNAEGTAYRPAPGEFIVDKLFGGTNLATVTSAATGLQAPLWVSDVIPDYLLPIGLKFDLWGNASVLNAAGNPSAMIAACVLGSIPTQGVALSYLYPLASTGTPNSSGLAVGWSLSSGKAQISIKQDGAIAHEAGRGTPERHSPGSLASGANRLYIMGDSSKIGDQFVVYQIIAQVVGVGG